MVIGILNCMVERLFSHSDFYQFPSENLRGVSIGVPCCYPLGYGYWGQGYWGRAIGVRVKLIFLFLPAYMTRPHPAQSQRPHLFAPIYSVIHNPIHSLNSWTATGQTVDAALENQPDHSWFKETTTAISELVSRWPPHAR